MFFYFVFLFVFFLSLKCDGGESLYSVTRDSDYEKAFSCTSGWTGADGAYSLSIGDGKTIWLFGDTLIGESSSDGKYKKEPLMINNSIGIQEKGDPSTIKFIYGGTVEKPEALFKPPDGNGWFWVWDGFFYSKEKKVSILLSQIDATPEGGAFGFKQIGLWLVKCSINKDKISIGNYKKLPYFKSTSNSTISFGSAIMVDSGWIYIYGTEDLNYVKKLLLARIPENCNIGDTEWEFYTGSGWSKNMEESGVVLEGVCNELSVHKTGKDEYFLITQKDGMKAEIVLFTSTSPAGPWKNPLIVWSAPEMKDNIIVYNAKAHPELSDKERGLLISYNVNSIKPEDLLVNSSIYRPRFIRVKFKNL